MTDSIRILLEWIKLVQCSFELNLNSREAWEVESFETVERFKDLKESLKICQIVVPDRTVYQYNLLRCMIKYVSDIIGSFRVVQ